MGRFWGIASAALLALAACTAAPTAAVPPEISISVVAENLDAPWAVGLAPDGRIFVAERSGTVRVVRNDILVNEPWLSLESARGGEAGLLGLAIDPGFAQNHFVYVAYTYRDAGGQLRNRLVRVRDDAETQKGVVDKVLLDGVLGSANHDGGRVKVGPDGKLYWTTGDAQRPDLAQDLSSLNGKILRLNTDGAIPPDNPFPGSPVYSYGHRNPQGLAWQPGTGRLYATEHGPTAHDEVNYIEPGKNYGWPAITGGQNREGMEAPVLHGGFDTWAPSGAAFVTVGPWAGSLLFAGLRGQSLYRLTLDAADPRRVAGFERLLSGQYGRLRDVVQASDGAIYVLTCNRDGRGSPTPNDDRLLKLAVR
ncbi:MAG: PQQ-dependent sugar dehydrogenase [Dehalococcoidia bacterium]|nr:PQQ-dependent sugar dehydrogenase [Dehalococcoidia bacterium]